MILFFDRSVGDRIPQALLHLKSPVGIEYHRRHFAPDCPDDVWLAEVGRHGWFVVSQDYKHHVLPNELAAIRQFNVGLFYLEGAELPMWETMRLIMRTFDRIVAAAESTPRPFVFRVRRNGRLIRLALP